MSTPAFHHIGPYGPVCGAARGVNAEDMDPPEVTCRRCRKQPPVFMSGKRYIYDGDRVLIAQGNPEDLTKPRCGQWSGVRPFYSGPLRAPGIGRRR